MTTVTSALARFVAKLRSGKVFDRLNAVHAAEESGLDRPRGVCVSS